MSKKKEKKTIAIDHSDYKTLKAMCRKYEASLRDLIHRLAIYPEFTGNVLQLPSEITTDTLINLGTIDNFLPLWVANTRDNLDAIKAGKDIKDIPQKNEPALIIGAGPSITRKKHLELLAKKEFNGTIFATDSILKSCLEHGIVPDYALIIDGTEKVLSHIDHNIIDDYANEIDAIMCVFTHPKVVKRWKGETFWFENIIPDALVPNVTRIINLLCDKTLLVTSGHVSSAGWAVAFDRGRNPIISIGVDLANPMDVPIEKAWNYEDKIRVLNREKIKELYKNYHHHTVFGTDCYYDPESSFFITNSLIHLKLIAEKGVRMINCTEGGTLEGEGIECMNFEDYLNSQ